MRCFNKKAVHQQHLQEEVKWLQQMLAKEQQSKQAVLGQLQDERAKCALLELEILHAAQAAQEMGESLCLFFNPCYQQSEQQALQQGQGQYGSGGVLHVEGSDPPCAHTLFQQPQQKQSKQQQQQQQGEDDGLQMAQLFGTGLLDEHYPTQQQQPQQRQARQNSLKLPPEQMTQEGHGPYSAAATAEAATESKQDDLPSDPDTAAHDQTPTKLRESAVLLASTNHWPTNSEGRLHSPRRSLKLSSPGRKSSPRRLARNSPGRSLRVRSSSPMKPPAAPAAAAAGGGAGGSLVLGTDSSTDQQQLAACASQEKDVTCGPDAPQPADAAASADMSAAGAHLAAAAAAVPSTGGPNPAQTRGNSNRSTFSAAAAAAAAVQQSLSAASAAIAAAEALRGQCRVSTARSTPGDMQGSILAPAAAVAAATATTKGPLPSSTLTPAESMGNPLQLLPTTAVDATATEAAVEGSSLPVTHPKPRFTISQAGSGFDSNSSSSIDSAWGEPSHKLPASIVAQPLGPESDTAHSGSPGDKNSSGVAVLLGAANDTLQQQQQDVEGATDGSAAAAAAAVDADLWQPEQLRSQPVSVLVSSLACKSRCSSGSSGGGKGTAAASLAESGFTGRKQTISSSTSSASSTARGPDKVTANAVVADVHPVTVTPLQQQQQQGVPHSGGASSPPAVHPDTAGGTAACAPAAAAAAAAITANAAVDAAAADRTIQNAVAAAATAAAAAPAAAEVPTAAPGSNAHSAVTAAGPSTDNIAGIPVRKSTHRKPPLAPVPLPKARDQIHAAQGPGLSTRQAHLNSAAAAAAAEAAAAGARGMSTQLASRACGSQQQPLSLSRLQQQQQQQQQQGERSGTAGATAGTHSPLKSAVAVIVGPMHAAAFGPALVLQQTSANNSSSLPQCGSGNSSGTRPDCVHANAGMRMQQADQRGLAAAAAAVDAAGVRQAAPRRHYSSNSSRAPEYQRQPQTSSSLRKNATHAAAAAARHAAVPPRPTHTATAAAQTAADLERCYQAVCTPADCAPSSCLSPLHWHQTNLGSSRNNFHQAMMLAACSNPDSVMRQQLAFDQQDSKASGRSTAGRYLGSRGGASSRGFMSGKGQRACSKPRKGWMALF